MTSLRSLLRALFALCLLTVALAGCASKDDSKQGLEVDQEFLSEALGEDGQRKQVSREEILARRQAREQARLKAEAQARARKEAEDARRREAEAAGGAMAAKTNDPQYQELQTACKRCAFYSDAGELDRALEQATSLVNIRDKSPEAHVVLGVIHRKRGDYDKALQEFEKAYTLEPDNEWAVANLGQSHRRNGNFKKCEELYLDHLSRYPNAQLVLYNMGIFQELFRGDKKQALTYYVRYLRAGGERKEEVNPWVTVLALDLNIPRPATPGWVSPDAVEAAGAAAVAEAPAPEAVGAEVAGAEATAPGEGAAEAAVAGAAPDAAVAPEAPEAAGATPAPVAAVVPAPAPAPAPAERVAVTLYPFEVAKGAVDPAVLQQIDQIFRDILGLGVDLSAPAAIDAAEKAKGWSGKCGSPNCQVLIAFELKAKYLVHGEVAQSPTSWYVIVDIYNLETRSKARLKLQAAVEEGPDAFYAKLRAMAKATGRKVSE